MKTKFQVTERPGLHGIDILAKKDGRALGVEVKGDRPGLLVAVEPSTSTS